MKNGKINARDLKINLKSRKESEMFKWFFVCLLFGKPIQQEIVIKTYYEFEKRKKLSLNKIINSKWKELVKILDKGHYVRYDFSTADKLLEISKKLRKEYGSINNLIKSSKNSYELKKKLLKFNGIGPTTARIFIRGLKKEKIIS